MGEGPSVLEMGGMVQRRPHVTFLVTVTKYPTEAKEGGKADFGSPSDGRPTMTGEPWWQDYEAAGHIASTARKQREMNAGTHLTFSFLFSPWNGAGHMQDGPLRSSVSPARDSPRGSFPR